MGKSQKTIFLNGEGDGWNARNRIVGDRLADKRKTDPVLQVLNETENPPARVLEIGAGNGWRLSILKERWPGAEFFGLDPSAQAVAEAQQGLHLQQGTAEDLPFEDKSFDLVIFGFCLYLCDRADLFKIAAEADRILRENGQLLIYDFHADPAYRNPYTHAEGLYSYKMDYSTLFSWNPAYRLIEKHVILHPGCTDETPDNRVSVSVLHKDTALGWPDNPYGQ
ncbi:MAG: class I SAM-dependent methyltransferase [Alphaproteobacteria bacterium]|nr:class I SAM-dependent methyltransferase [Alphaproteobacteria bacterium]